MERFKNSLLLLIGLVLILGSLYFSFREVFVVERSMATLMIGDNTFQVDIARTDEARTRGLSGRESLEEGSGMLFIFEEPGQYSFWMRDMRFAIDIVWIDQDSKIIGIEKYVSPDTYPQIFYPKIPIKYVLELPSGNSEKFGIDIGDLVYLK